jgi:hypothetical protein
MLPNKIISGGQTGADRAGLDYAIENNIEHGGWCPAGRRSEEGIIPTRYQLEETRGDSGYQKRTKLNVSDSHATLIFNRGMRLSAGCALTLRSCERSEKPFLIVTVPEAQAAVTPAAMAAEGRKIAEFLAYHRPEVLNIAGNREQTTPGIHAWVKLALASAWDQYADAEKRVTPAGKQEGLFGLGHLDLDTPRGRSR